MSRIRTAVFIAGALMTYATCTPFASAGAPSDSGALAGALAMVDAPSAVSHMPRAAEMADQAYVSNLITVALSAARAANPLITPAELIRIATEVATSKEAIAGLSAIATTATATAIAGRNLSGDPAEAKDVAAAIQAAVNAGSRAAVDAIAASMHVSNSLINAPEVKVTISAKATGLTVAASAVSGGQTVTAEQFVSAAGAGALRTYFSSIASASTDKLLIPPVRQLDVVSPASE